MKNRKRLLTLAIASLTLGLPATHWAFAQSTPASTQPGHEGHKGEQHEEHEHEEKGDHKRGEYERGRERDHEEKDEHEDHDEREEHEEDDEHEIETAVPLNMVPQAVLDAVKKEVPSGNITESELKVKKGKIVYGFDVMDGEITYDITISVDGKFMSKVVDDEADEKDEADAAAKG